MTIRKFYIIVDGLKIGGTPNSSDQSGKLPYRTMMYVKKYITPTNKAHMTFSKAPHFLYSHIKIEVKIKHK